ncbi:MAG: hypothetical protein PHR06_14025 [Candidatus Cloacimonetes bacterium]|nr:hypothetical protein [Candidatus Cloacimonadota bacterium]
MLISLKLIVKKKYRYVSGSSLVPKVINYMKKVDFKLTDELIMKIESLGYEESDNIIDILKVL